MKSLAVLLSLVIALITVPSAAAAGRYAAGTAHISIRIPARIDVKAVPDEARARSKGVDHGKREYSVRASTGYQVVALAGAEKTVVAKSLDSTNRSRFFFRPPRTENTKSAGDPRKVSLVLLVEPL